MQAQTLLNETPHLSAVNQQQPDTANTTQTDSGEINLVLHTKTVTDFFKTSWSYQQIGLRRFAKVMQLLWQAVKQDDPYAEWYLMQTYDQIGLLQETFKQLENDCSQYLNQKRGFEIVLLTSQNPFRFLLRFGNPFSYLSAQLFADLDYVFRQTYTLKKIGVLLDEDKLPVKLMQKLRTLFTQGTTWKYTGVTREDLGQQNQKAQQAEEAMGKLPAVILNRDVRFGLLPKVQQHKVYPSDLKEMSINTGETQSASYN